MKTGLRRFLSRGTPPFRRILFVESGSRSIAEKWLGWASSAYPEVGVDLLTCYEGTPTGFTGAVFLTHDYPDNAARDRLMQEFRANRYDLVAIVCSDEPVMTKWKWFTAIKVPVKVLIVNENADWFWLDRGHWGTIRQFFSVRTGLSGSGALTQPLQAAVLPFSLLYVTTLSAWIHLRRRLS